MMTRCVRPHTGGAIAAHPSRMRCDCEDRTGNGFFGYDRLDVDQMATGKAA